MLAIQGVQIARLERVLALSTESGNIAPVSVTDVECWFFFAGENEVPSRVFIDGESVGELKVAEGWASTPSPVRIGVLNTLEGCRHRRTRVGAAGPSSPYLWVRSRSKFGDTETEVACDLFNPQENAVKSQVFEILSASLLHDLRNQLTVLSNTAFALSTIKEGDVERAASCLELGAKGIRGAESLIQVASGILTETKDDTTTEALLVDLVELFKPRFQKFHQEFRLTQNTPGELRPDPWMLKLVMVVGVEFFRKQISRGGALEVSLEATGSELELCWKVLDEQESIEGPEAVYRTVGLNALGTEDANLWRVQVPLVVEEVFDER